MVVDEKENLAAIVNGSLNKRFRVSHLLFEHGEINELLSELESEKKEIRIKTCIVKDSEDEIILVFKNKNCGSEKAFNVSFVKKKLADSLPRVQATRNEKPAFRPMMLHRKKRERSLEE